MTIIFYKFKWLLLKSAIRPILETSHINRFLLIKNYNCQIVALEKWITFPIIIGTKKHPSRSKGVYFLVKSFLFSPRSLLYVFNGFIRWIGENIFTAFWGTLPTHDSPSRNITTRSGTLFYKNARITISKYGKIVYNHFFGNLNILLNHRFPSGSLGKVKLP